MKTKLIIFEGFDRVGKDQLLKQLDSNIKKQEDSFVYIQHIPSDMPKYRSDPQAFVKWLRGYISNQIDDLVNLSKSGYKKIYMTRLLASDNVYATMFNRTKVVEDFIQKIVDNFEVENIFFTFKNYDEYLGRLKMINDSYIEYSKDEFNKVNEIYLNELDQLGRKYGMTYKVAYILKEQWLKEFLGD